MESKPAQNLRLEWVSVGSNRLTPNPNNWRRHPGEQLAAIRETLADPDVGWAGALLFNERTGRLIDGHGRLAVLPPDAIVPVLVGSWSEEAEKKILLTLDPIGAMAQADSAQLAALLADVDLDGPGLAELGKSLADQLPKDMAAAFDDGDDDGDGGTAGAGAGRQYLVVITCHDAEHQEFLLTRLAAEGLRVRPMAD